VVATNEALNGDSFRWSNSAIDAVQAAAESYMVGYFEDANMCAAHRNRITVNTKDMTLTTRLRERFEQLH
jgi:histone H3/H4